MLMSCNRLNMLVNKVDTFYKWYLYCQIYVNSLHIYMEYKLSKHWTTVCFNHISLEIRTLFLILITENKCIM